MMEASYTTVMTQDLRRPDREHRVYRVQKTGQSSCQTAAQSIMQKHARVTRGQCSAVMTQNLTFISIRMDVSKLGKRNWKISKDRKNTEKENTKSRLISAAVMQDQV